MNIFLVSSDVNECAKVLDDLRLNKMILETAQMLCTAYRALFPHLATVNKDLLYKQTHVNHPCNVWMRECITNYKWSYELFAALAKEKYFRTGLWHLSYMKLSGLLLEPALATGPFVMNVNPSSSINFTFDCSNVYDMPNATVFERYRECLMRKWINDTRVPKWTNRHQPDWR